MKTTESAGPRGYDAGTKVKGRKRQALVDTDDLDRKPPGQVGFVVHPRRWVVQRFFAWISRNRRLWTDPEATIASAKAFLYAASVMMLLRRIGCAA